LAQGVGDGPVESYAQVVDDPVEAVELVGQRLAARLAVGRQGVGLGHGGSS